MKRTHRSHPRPATIKQLDAATLAQVVGGTEDIGEPKTYNGTGQTGCTMVEATGAKTTCLVQWT